MRIKEILVNLDQIHKKYPTISEPMICGGLVRDIVIGHVVAKHSDLDITNGDATIKNLAEEFAVSFGKKYSVKKSVAEDGHVSIYLDNFKIDFSSNFLVPDIDNILSGMGVESATPMQKEIYSRDFTCNALLLSLDLKTVSDPTGRGLEDIKKKVIKTCLDPKLTFAFNVNRIPRIIYMACKLGFEVDPAIISWVRNNPKYVSQCKAKYIAEKIEKAMQYNSERTISLISQMNLWNLIPISVELQPYYQKVTR